MKFDYCIGNPAYQETQDATSDKPIYNDFMDEAFKIADKVEMVTPARFLFGAGKTPKAWNEKMLNDEHFKVLEYAPNSASVFPGTTITGGVAVTYRDAGAQYGALGTFTAFPELNSIMTKVKNYSSFDSLSQLVYSPESYKFTSELHKDFPEIKYHMENGAEAGILSKGHDFDITSNIFEKLNDIVFFENKPLDGDEYIQIYGRFNTERTFRWIKRKYIAEHSNLHKYKVVVSKANGASGSLGDEPARLITVPVAIGKEIGLTQTFISIGSFDTKQEVEAAVKYIKTKFARALLGVLKITQDNKKNTWRYVPIQDFTRKSDINWNTSIQNIDRQLYKKYNLSPKEIEFIETHVKEMEE